MTCALVKPDLEWEGNKLVSDLFDDAGLRDTANAWREGWHGWKDALLKDSAEYSPFTEPYWICGSSIKPTIACREHGVESHYLCDYPVGKGQTCDLPLCSGCRRNIAHDTDFCEIHFAEFVGKSGSASIRPWPPQRSKP
jgi:hypothetical protein